MKRLLNSLFGLFGYELCRLSKDELATLPRDLDLNYKEAQIFRALTASGQISISEARFLTELVRSTNPDNPIIEVGALYGYSTIFICVAKTLEQKLYVVDNFSWNSLGISTQTHFAATKMRLQECIADFNVELINSSAKDFYTSYRDKPAALFFCDADHRYEAVYADISWARSQGSTIICGDDYAVQHEGVKRAVDEFGGPKELHGELWKL